MRLDLIAPSARRSGENLHEIIGSIAKGECIYIEGRNAVLILQLINDDEGRSVHCWIGGGDLSEIKQMLPGVEALARGLGCRFASFKGRKGWGRAFPDYPWNGRENRKYLNG